MVPPEIFGWWPPCAACVDVEEAEECKISSPHVVAWFSRAFAVPVLIRGELVFIHLDLYIQPAFCCITMTIAHCIERGLTEIESHVEGLTLLLLQHLQAHHVRELLHQICGRIPLVDTEF